MSGTKYSIWDILHIKLVESSPVKHCDEINFIVGLIVSGGKEKDLVYLANDDFIYHCKLAGLDPSFISTIIDRMWYHIDNKIPFPNLEGGFEEEEIY